MKIDSRHNVAFFLAKHIAPIAVWIFIMLVFEHAMVLVLIIMAVLMKLISYPFFSY